MTRPQISVTISEALARRGNETPTGTAFLIYAHAAGPLTPTLCRSAADATAASVPDATAALVGDCLAEGAPGVYILRAAAVDVAAVTQPEWATALAKLTVDLGAGQVLIPGVSTAAAYAALIAHAAATGRCVLLDTTATPTPATVASTAAGLAAGNGAERATIVTPWVTCPGPGGTTHDTPGSVIAAGRAAAGDAAIGHANQAPAGLQRGGAGVSQRGITVTKLFTDTETDTMYDAGVNAIRMVRGKPTLMGWASVTDDDLFHQLNAGRICMQMVSQLSSIAEVFLFRQIDGRGHLYAELEGALRGYLQPLWTADALYGATADDAFSVDVAGVNNPTTAAAGELHAAIEARLSQHAEKVIFNVVVATAEGAAA